MFPKCAALILCRQGLCSKCSTVGTNLYGTSNNNNEETQSEVLEKLEILKEFENVS